MSSKSARETEYMLNTLQRAGISRADAEALRRISMTLHRWHELECGCEHGAIERDEDTQRTYWVHASLPGAATTRRTPCADRETGARKRLAAIMARYPTLSAYIQGDPRGCALYVIRPGDLVDGQTVDSCYSRGLAVHK